MIEKDISFLDEEFESTEIKEDISITIDGKPSFVIMSVSRYEDSVNTLLDSLIRQKETLIDNDMKLFEEGHKSNSKEVKYIKEQIKEKEKEIAEFKEKYLFLKKNID